MKWKKAPQALIDRFDAIAAGFSQAEKKQMFGYPALFVNGHLTAGLFEDGCMIRVPEGETGLLPFEPMKGRPMKDYGSLPKAAVDDPAAMKAWIAKAVAWAEKLPVKAKKPKKPAKKRS
jgi:TfoX/Sxy family transcriptional regulator of competence genes